MMKEFLWIAAVRLLSVVSLMIRLCLEAGHTLKTMCVSGARGRKLRNGKLTPIHRQRIVGLPSSRAWLIERLPAGAIHRGLPR